MSVFVSEILNGVEFNRLSLKSGYWRTLSFTANVMIVNIQYLNALLLSRSNGDQPLLACEARVSYSICRMIEPNTLGSFLTVLEMLLIVLIVAN